MLTHVLSQKKMSKITIMRFVGQIQLDKNTVGNGIVDDYGAGVSCSACIKVLN